MAVKCLLPLCSCVGRCQAALYKPTPAPRHVPSAPSLAKMELWNGRQCPYCGSIMHTDDLRRRPTRDHIDPRALGGPNASFNLVVACALCNGQKGSMTLEQFYVHLVERNDARAGFIARFIRGRSPAKYTPPKMASKIPQSTHFRMSPVTVSPGCQNNS